MLHHVFEFPPVIDMTHGATVKLSQPLVRGIPCLVQHDSFVLLVTATILAWSLHNSNIIVGFSVTLSLDLALGFLATQLQHGNELGAFQVVQATFASTMSANDHDHVVVCEANKIVLGLHIGLGVRSWLWGRDRAAGDDA